jgi:hypothetical protein
LNKEGEKALRKALSCCLDLHDRDRAFILYQEYREVKEQEVKEQDDIPWNPEKKTEDLWQEVLMLNDAA